MSGELLPLQSKEGRKGVCVVRASPLRDATPAALGRGAGAAGAASPSGLPHSARQFPTKKQHKSLL